LRTAYRERRGCRRGALPCRRRRGRAHARRAGQVLGWAAGAALGGRCSGRPRPRRGGGARRRARAHLGDAGAGAGRAGMPLGRGGGARRRARAHLGDAGAVAGRAGMTLSDRVRETVWPRRGMAGQLGYLALRPLSGLFGLGVGLRGLGYRIGLLRTRQAKIPVVSIGNLAVGGTGKTPLTLWLARDLVARGPRRGIRSPGYGGRARGVTVVSQGDGPLVGPELVGDEPVMLAKSFAGPVLTAPRRLAGAAAAAELGCEVIVLDDGFQHRAIARAFDLVLVDGRRGPLLPAGPLREPLRALRRADAVVLVERDDGDPAAPPPSFDRPTF